MKMMTNRRCAECNILCKGRVGLATHMKRRHPLKNYVSSKVVPSIDAEFVTTKDSTIEMLKIVEIQLSKFQKLKEILTNLNELED